MSVRGSEDCQKLPYAEEALTSIGKPVAFSGDARGVSPVFIGMAGAKVHDGASRACLRHVHQKRFDGPHYQSQKKTTLVSVLPHAFFEPPLFLSIPIVFVELFILLNSSLPNTCSAIFTTKTHVSKRLPCIESFAKQEHVSKICVRSVGSFPKQTLRVLMIVSFFQLCFRYPRLYIQASGL